ncbi:hypothetical protein HPB48_023213 [Haemaphysalis longicornis]|uniref:Uncharacterized protein n=1 Tax=Haemaphysalis longicornis TaxID=44386 RepID=A0A9J6H5Q7_HAELO|nr:hypothetical protein HPB48_023213 [Haemaphysalis longicornis]
MRHEEEAGEEEAIPGEATEAPDDEGVPQSPKLTQEFGRLHSDLRLHTNVRLVPGAVPTIGVPTAEDPAHGGPTQPKLRKSEGCIDAGCAGSSQSSVGSLLGAADVDLRTDGSANAGSYMLARYPQLTLRDVGDRASSPAKCLNFLNSAGICCISQRTFYRIQKKILLPAVDQVSIAAIKFNG